MGDVLQRVFELPFRQGAQGPVREALGLVEPRARKCCHQGLGPNLVAEPADHGRHLGVEHRMRHLAHGGAEDFQVLSPGMEDLQGLRVVQEGVQRA